MEEKPGKVMVVEKVTTKTKKGVKKTDTTVVEVKTKKPCNMESKEYKKNPTGVVCNEETGRWVGKTSKKGKEILATTKTPKSSTPVVVVQTEQVVTTSASPKGWVGNTHVQLGKKLLFNMNVDCKGTKRANPQNYDGNELKAFAKAIQVKPKKTNLLTCQAIKDAILVKYPKPTTKTPTPKATGGNATPVEQQQIVVLTPTPKKPPTLQETREAIKKCLGLTH